MENGGLRRVREAVSRLVELGKGGSAQARQTGRGRPEATCLEMLCGEGGASFLCGGASSSRQISINISTAKSGKS